MGDEITADNVGTGRLTVRGGDGCDGLYHLADGPRDERLAADELQIETTNGTVRVVADAERLAIDTVDEDE
jgi:hypothetical protein